MSSPLRSLGDLIVRLRRDRAANVAVIFAVVLVPVVASMGAAVDFSNVYMIRNQLQDAADSASIGSIVPSSVAFGAATNMRSDGPIPIGDTDAIRLFNTNIAGRSGFTLSNVSADVAKNDGVLTATVKFTASVKTYFLGLIGMDTIRRIGLLYDPAHNEEFFKSAADFASTHNISILPLRVDGRKEIPSLLKNYLTDMDALWLIPDRTVISESIVRYVIKEAFLRNVPTIGYNRFFYESGALMAFIFNYQDLGEQAAQKVLAVLSGRTCGDSVPAFQVWINKRVAEKLERKVSETLLPPFIFGP